MTAGSQRPIPPTCLSGQPPTRAALSVWATGQRTDPAQLADGGYLPETAHDTTRMPPAAAAHAITDYTRVGDTVLDPDCGAGTVLVEALRAGRHAIGITDSHRWWATARANVTAARHPGGAHLDGMVLNGGPDTLATAHLAGLTGQVALVLTALRHPGHTPQSASLSGDINPDPDNAAQPTARVHTMLSHSRRLLAPGGHVIITARPRCCGHLLDLPSHVLAAGQAAGLILVERCVALTGELHGDRFIARASTAQCRCAARTELATGHPVSLTAHHEVLIFQAPLQQDAAVSRLAPPLRPSRARHRTSGYDDLLGRTQDGRAA